MSVRNRFLDDPESVSPEQVMRYWLHEEVDEADDSLDAYAVDTEPALRTELFERNPISERVFAAEETDWYYADLTEEAFRDLRVLVGTPDEDWRAVADDNRIESIARRIYETDDLAKLDEQTPRDLREVVEIADDIDREGLESRLVVVKEGDDPAYVADGHHRAVAHALYLLRGGEFTGQEAYLGVRE